MRLKQARTTTVSSNFSERVLKKLNRGDNAPCFWAFYEDLAAFLSDPHSERAPLTVQSHAVVEAFVRNGKPPSKAPLSELAQAFLARSKKQDRTKQNSFALALARSLHLRVKDCSDDQRRLMAEHFLTALSSSQAPQFIKKRTSTSIHISRETP